MDKKKFQPRSLNNIFGLKNQKFKILEKESKVNKEFTTYKVKMLKGKHCRLITRNMIDVLKQLCEDTPEPVIEIWRMWSDILFSFLEAGSDDIYYMLMQQILLRIAHELEVLLDFQMKVSKIPINITD